MRIEAIEKAIEKSSLDKVQFDRTEKMEAVNKSFKSSVQPEKGVYGVTERSLDNGFREIRSHNELGLKKRDIFDAKGNLTRTIEKIADKTWRQTKYDDNGLAYLKETTVRGDSRSHSIELAPSATIKRGNITTKTDALGRTVFSKITDLELSNDVRSSLSKKLRDKSYSISDQIGHLIPDSFGGPASKENVIPQTSEVNQSLIKRVENIARDLKREGHVVDYEVKVNYDGESARPSSFEPKITVDGKEYPLENSLKKIYNGDFDAKERLFVDIKEKANRIDATTRSMRETGMKQGVEAAKITCAISTVDNVIHFIDGEISADEMAFNIVRDTGEAGVAGYAIGFISDGIADGLSATGNELMQAVAGSNAPAAFASFAVATQSSVIDFAIGRIDATELAYDLGNNALSVTGTMVGANYGAVVGTAITPGIGTIAGSLAGGVIGCTLATGAYKTAIEYGSKGAEALADKARQVGNATIEYAKENVPERAEEIKRAFNTFAEKNSLSFSFI